MLKWLILEVIQLIYLKEIIGETNHFYISKVVSVI